MRRASRAHSHGVPEPAHGAHAVVPTTDHAALAAAIAHALAEQREEAEAEELRDASKFDITRFHFELLQFLTIILEYFGGIRTDTEIMCITNTYATWFADQIQPTEEVAKLELFELFDDFKELRESLSRMSVIKRTNFIPAGYGLMNVLVYITVILTSLAKYGSDPVDVPAGGGGRRLVGLSDAVTTDINVYSNLVICEGGRASPLHERANPHLHPCPRTPPPQTRSSLSSCSTSLTTSRTPSNIRFTRSSRSPSASTATLR